MEEVMKEWQFDLLKEEHRQLNVKEVEVECYANGEPVPDGVEATESYMEIWHQCSCGKKYRTEEEATECCFPHYHVDYEE
jgi:hypothetical protein